MSYIDKAGLIARFGQDIDQLIDRNGDGVEDDGVLAAAIADAEATIDAKIGSRYATPLDPVPAIIVAIAADITRARLYHQAKPEIVEQREKAALELLDQIEQGAIKLNATEAGAGYESTTYEREFTRDTLAGF